MSLQNDNANLEWRALLEPLNRLTAKEQAEGNNYLDSDKWSIRGAFVTDGRRNYAYGSD